MRGGRGAENIGFATKPRLALDMLADAVRAAVPARWAAGDEVYGNDPAFHSGVRALDLGYVLVVARDHRITVRGGIRRRADQIAADLPATAWQRYSAGTGSKGPRWYDWAWIQAQDDDQVEDSLLIRRNPAAGELAFYRTWNPQSVALPALVHVAGTRCAVEESFQAAKGQVGPDHYQVRGWTPWHRHATLAMLAPRPSPARTAPPTSTHRSRRPSPKSGDCSPARRAPKTRTPDTSCTGQPGADTTKPKPAEPTTDDA